MEPDQAQRLGQFLRKARQDKQLSAMQLSELTGISDASIIRTEQGKVNSPAPDKLVRIAEALDVPVADVFALAEYMVVDELPTFAPYLRTKYAALPEEAVEALQSYAEHLAHKHGVQFLDGPDPGEDEKP